MSIDSSPSGSIGTEVSGNAFPLRAIVGFAVNLILLSLALFVSAGTTEWPQGWIAVGLMMAASLGSRLLVWRLHPDLLVERARFPVAEGTASWDRWLVPWVGIIGPLSVLVVAGLDRRWGWTGPVPPAVPLTGLVLTSLGYGLTVWAMGVNRFFSSVARIQRDRGHRVIRSGPYAIVRHPGYLGSAIANIGGPLLLGSLWALVPAVLVNLALALRTSLEDEFLLAGLPGYRQYATLVGYRWIPFVW